MGQFQVRKQSRQGLIDLSDRIGRLFSNLDIVVGPLACPSGRARSTLSPFLHFSIVDWWRPHLDFSLGQHETNNQVRHCYIISLTEGRLCPLKLTGLTEE